MLLLRNFIAALKQGAKITPDDLAGMIGLPHVGNLFYIDPTNGNDTANSGSMQDDAFKTMFTAEAATTNVNHDVVIVTPGGTAGTSETQTVTWNNSYTHLIGNTAPAMISQRSRIVSTTDSVDPCFVFSGQGCMIKNIQLATYQASNDVLTSLTNNRNVFANVHFAGIGHETAGDDTTARSLVLTAAEENVFSNCVIGLDTVARSVANAEIEFASAATRNIFEDCRINQFADNAGHLAVTIGLGGIDRFVEFKNCLFFNPLDSTATGMTVMMSIHASAGGSVILSGMTQQYGATDWANDFTNLLVGGPVPTGATSNFLIQGA